MSESPRFTVRHMRGYRPPYWVDDNTNIGNGVDGSYTTREQADRHAALRNEGVSRETASAAVHAGQEVIRAGDLVFVDLLGTPLIPAKVLTVERVPVPGAPNSAYTQWQVRVRLTAARPGYRRGEVLVKTGNNEIVAIVPRKSVRTVNGSIRVSSGVFSA